MKNSKSLNDFKRKFSQGRYSPSKEKEKKIGKENGDRLSQLSGSIVKILEKEAKVGSHTSKKSMSLLSTQEREKMKQYKVNEQADNQ